MLKRAFKALPATLAGAAMVAVVFSIPMLMMAFPVSVHVSLASWTPPNLSKN
jgi:hypothetical protein